MRLRCAEHRLPQGPRNWRLQWPSKIVNSSRMDCALNNMAEFPLEGSDTEQLSVVMSTLYNVFQTHHQNIETTLQEITHAVRDCVPGAEQASISIARYGHAVQACAATGLVAAEVDSLQTELGDGPCLHALFECRAVSIPDMRTERRWPRFALAAHVAGIGSMLSLKLFVENAHLGALNLYSNKPRAFDSYSECIAFLFATHAAIAAAGKLHEDSPSPVAPPEHNR